jgi:hypothetical protein
MAYETTTNKCYRKGGVPIAKESFFARCENHNDLNVACLIRLNETGWRVVSPVPYETAFFEHSGLFGTPFTLYS